MLTHRSLLLRLLPLSLLAATLSCGGEGGGSTGPTPNPVPTLTSLSRDTAMAGATPFLITLRGTGFVPGIQATIGGTARTTVRSSDTVATVQTVAADLATVTTREVRVVNPEPGGGASEALTLTVHPAPPVPVLDSLSPDSAAQGSGTLTLELHGAGFTPKTTARWNAGILTTTYVSPTRLDATVPAGDLVAPLTAQITAVTPAPGGGTSTSRSFVVLPPPAITGTTPDSVEVGPGSIPVQIRGERFTGADSVRYFYQGAPTTVTPTLVTDTSLLIDLDRNGLASSGALSFRVHTSAGWSAFHVVELYNPVPVVTGIFPDTIDGSLVADTFLVVGSGFVPGSFVSIGVPTVSSTTVLAWDTLKVVVTESTLFLGGVQSLRVHDGWDGKASLPHDIAIISPQPVLDSIAGPALDSIGGSGTFSLAGSSFRGNGVVLIDGVPRAPDYLDATTATFSLTTAETTAPDTLSIAFHTPGPGGGTTAPVGLAIVPPNPVPTLTGVDRQFLPADSGAVTVTLSGHGFLPGTSVELHLSADPGPLGSPLATTVLSDSTLAVTIPVDHLGLARTVYLRARAPGPTAGSSESVSVTTLSHGVKEIRVRDDYVVNVVGDPVNDHLFAVTIRNSVYQVIAIDPLTGLGTDSLSLGGAAYRLALAADGSALFVAAGAGGLLALDPATLDTMYHVPAGLMPDSSQAFVFEVSASRNDPDLVVIRRGPSSLSPSTTEIIAINGGVPLPQVVQLPGASGGISLDLADSDTVLAGLTSYVSSGALYRRMTVGDSGVTLALTTPANIETGHDIVVAGDIVHTSANTAINLMSGSPAAGSAWGNQWRLSRGRSTQRAYATRQDDAGEFTIFIFLLGDVVGDPIEYSAVPVGLGILGGITTWGIDGFAVGGTEGLLIGRSAATDE